MSQPQDITRPFVCEGCPDVRRNAWYCPDKDLRRKPGDELPLNGSRDEPGVTLYDQCPGYWKRDPVKWGLDLPWAADTRSVFAVASEMRFAVEHGAGGLIPSMPAKLHDAVSIIAHEEARELERIRKKADGANH